MIPISSIWADRTRTPAFTAAAHQFAADYGVTVEVQEIGMGDIRANLGAVVLMVKGPTSSSPRTTGSANWC